MDEQTPEFITASQARRLLGVSKPTLARLIREGALPTTDSPLDKRVKLVRTSDVLALRPFQRQRPPGGGSGGRPDRRDPAEQYQRLGGETPETDPAEHKGNS